MTDRDMGYVRCAQWRHKVFQHCRLGWGTSVAFGGGSTGSTCGYCFVLVLVDYATCYPEVMPLQASEQSSMIRKFVHDDDRNWDSWLDPLLFIVWEVPQASTG